MARRLGACRIAIGPLPDPQAASQWTQAEDGLEVRISIADLEDHDIAMELLLCLGQALWGKLSTHEVRAYLALLEREAEEGVGGEIDEQALAAKRCLSRDYCFSSFAGTAAEYVHSLWHEVTIRTGPEHLTAPQLRRRLQLLARWFPPDRGYRLFAGRRSAKMGR